VIITLYELRFGQPEPVIIDVDQLEADIRHAAYRFWVSERRMPAAIIIPLQLGQALTGTTGITIFDKLKLFGAFPVDDVDLVPLLAREASLDPLFILV
jgi:hypothetical protein